MARNSTPITFAVFGRDNASGTPAAVRGAVAGRSPSLATVLADGEIKHSVRLGAVREGGAALRLSAVPGEDVVVLHLAQGPSLVLSPENARLLMLAQSTRKRPSAGGASSTRGGRSSAPGHDDDVPVEAVPVPVELQWHGLEATQRGATRGALGKVLLAGLDIVAGAGRRWLQDRVADFAASRVVKHFDDQVRAGVYPLESNSLPPLKGLTPTKVLPDHVGPTLVLIHGTFSTTAGTFGKLWGEHPDKVRALFDRYDRQVYALDHPTLGASPIDNALTLVRALPVGTRLHLLTHSRGGLVAEVLARVCAARGALSSDAAAMFAAPAEAGALAALRELAGEVAKRRITVERIVRVACPARGTLLASKRLDAYLSVLKWTMELATVPVLPEFLELLGEVARRRADPAELPGLAAMLPDSPLVQWLHAPIDPLPGDLRVVAGDLQGDSVTSWLKTLLADGFYRCDNDLVVHTSSMYGGPPRRSAACFKLDRGGEVSHFNYFRNRATASAIVDALLQQETPPTFSPIGPLSAQGLDASGLRSSSRTLTSRDSDAQRAAVVVLPGILGSNLKGRGERIWLSGHIIGGLKKLALSDDDGIEADGPVGLSYDALIDHLAQTHEVIAFGFDWRRPLESEARRLAARIEEALTARSTSGQPVRLLAHSMGGLLARTMQLECPQTWERLMARPGSRLLMLGTPNGGSWAPMQVLSGDDRFCNALVAFGAPFQDRSARQMMAAFPGFLQLQAGLADAETGLGSEKTWRDLAQRDLAAVREHNWWHSDSLQLTPYEWGVPPQSVLDQAVALRRRLDEQRDHVLPQYADRLLLVTGRVRFTPDGYEFTDEGLAYRDALDDGDGRVTLASARLPGVQTWQHECSHGDLSTARAAFEAYVELLETGATQRLTLLPEPGVARAGARDDHAAASAPAHLLRRPSRMLQSDDMPLTIESLWQTHDAAAGPPATAHGLALQVELLNANLSFVADPLMLGHYRSPALSGTEAVVDRQVNHALQASLHAGLYPDLPGSHAVFVNRASAAGNPWGVPRPQAVIVVGLGDEVNLTPSGLRLSVCQGALAWCQRLAGEGAGDEPVRLTATLIGSGGRNIAVGQAAQHVVLGVIDAQARLQDLNEQLRKSAGRRGSSASPSPQTWPSIERLTLVELYLDRAGEAWRALQALAAARPGCIDLAPTVRSGSGALRRPADDSYRGTTHELISALPQREGETVSRISYVLSTRRARSELHAHSTQFQLVRDLIDSAATHDNRDAQIGRTLYSLLVPPELDNALSGATSLVIELAARADDADTSGGTAAIPWELLDPRAKGTGSGPNVPLAIECKLLRRLQLAEFRAQVRDAHPGDGALVIGEPQCDLTCYPVLDAAREEAQEVAARLSRTLGASRVAAVTHADARDILNALYARDWRIVHIAGHGEPRDDRTGDPRGVVLSGSSFLGPREIQAMRVVPELVFINCCHLASFKPASASSTASTDAPGDKRQAGQPYNRAAFASNVAEALMNIGVRCVIAAGWAVDDEPAKRFATTFYAAILGGTRFIDAVERARRAAWRDGRDGNTWAAYQCYGDPDWVLNVPGIEAQPTGPSMAEQFAGIASAPGLTLALERIASDATGSDANVEYERDKIRHLASRFESVWGGIGAVAEAFGLAWNATRDLDQAVRWYAAAAQAPDGSASLRALEQLSNLRVRSAWEATQSAKPAELAPTARRSIAAIDAAIGDLTRLLEVSPTDERASLCGSACKRLAMVHALVDDRPAEAREVGRMRLYYQQAFDLGRRQGRAKLFYAGLNLLAAQWRGAGRLDARDVAAVRQNLRDCAATDPDFWSLVGAVELQLLEALDEGALPAQVAAIHAALADLHRRMPATWMWTSVHDQGLLVLRPLTGTRRLSPAKTPAKTAAKRLLESLRQWASPA